MWNAISSTKLQLQLQKQLQQQPERRQEPFGGSGAATRELFLRGLSACYFAAFASFLVQVPGLYGPQGLTPANDPATMERSCLQGLALACLGLCGCANVFVMYGMLVLYKGVVMAAQVADDGTFYNFQWDNLLVEVGFMAAVLAPVLHSALEPRPSGAALWMLRFILFKLMVMSGIVKLSTGAAFATDTWAQLTAIWYHFATQCIPTPAAWFFHNLPMPVEKLFCATMFMIEIPAAFLILVPVREVRVFAALLQIMLQVVIIITGNYTFFNYLTIFLACTLLDDENLPAWFRPTAVALDAWDEVGKSATDGRSSAAPAPEDLSNVTEQMPLLGADASQARPNALSTSSEDFQQALRKLSWAALAICGLWTAFQSTPYGFNSQFSIASPSNAAAWASDWIPRALILMSVVIPAVTCWDLFCHFFYDNAVLINVESRVKLLRRPVLAMLVVSVAVATGALLVLRGVVCFRMLSLMPGVLAQVAPDIGSKTVSIWPGGSFPTFTEMPLNLPHDGPFDYGLFRRMTGVGSGGKVARPELVLEVEDASTGVWHELQFQYKPGDLHKAPPLVAPYQPRLDWQMWFQALYFDNGMVSDWFSSLIDKILDGSPPVLALLDVASLPDAEIKALRIKFYSYNFTGYGEGSAWWHRTHRHVKHGVGLHYSTQTPVNLAREARKASNVWNELAVFGFMALAVFFCVVPLWLRPACSDLWRRRLHSLERAEKEG